MASRERIRAITSFRVPDRVGMFDWHWAAAVARWKAEGLPDDVDLTSHFGFDMVSVSYDQSFRLEHEVLEDDEETYVERTSYGMTQRQWKGSKQGAPHQLDTLIKTRADWERYKERFLPSADRFPADVAQRTRELHEKGYWVNYWYLEPFELTWRFFGFKEMLMLMASDPGFASELFGACAEQIIGSYEAAVAMGAEFDGNFAGGDIAGKNGPLFSPAMYRELLMPHHRRIFQYLNERDVPTFYHGDGDERPLLDPLIEAGVRVMHPLEAKAGMDLRELKPEYRDRLVLFGGIDVRALSGSKQDVEAEIRSKVPVAMEGGGYIYCVDHSVAPTVSLENYEYALSLIREVGRY
jgi:uroporphyrinogen decarboxylase